MRFVSSKIVVSRDPEGIAAGSQGAKTPGEKETRDTAKDAPRRGASGDWTHLRGRLVRRSMLAPLRGAPVNVMPCHHRSGGGGFVPQPYPWLPAAIPPGSIAPSNSDRRTDVPARFRSRFGSRFLLRFVFGIHLRPVTGTALVNRATQRVAPPFASKIVSPPSA